ncbi:hypothetical protein [Chitinimonas sp.]|uniref:hypothetical protein n=1 Tax=Chitinimonas sp. TaxID=1934313 RepID=UPI0035B1BDA3
MRIRIHTHPMRSPRRQAGSAILIFFLMVGVGLLTLIVSQLNNSKAQLAMQSSDNRLLANAKQALLEYAINQSGVSPPGLLLAPDTDFNGLENTPCHNIAGGAKISSGPNMRCVGLLPWRRLGLSEYRQGADPTGMTPWYAISANFDDNCYTNGFIEPLNPGVLSLPFIPTASTCPPSAATAGARLHPWLTVLDANGQLISNTVAAVIILPGPQASGQVRNASTASITNTVVPNYLQGVNGSLTNTYQIRPLGSSIPAASQNQLIYITVDELMSAAQRRAEQQAKRFLNGFYDASGTTASTRYFPYATALSGPTPIDALRLGGVPTSGAACKCTQTSCACSNSTSNATGSIAFTVNPTPGQTVTLNGTTITFVASGAAGLQVNVGATLGASLTNLQTLLAGGTVVSTSTMTSSLVPPVLNFSAGSNYPGASGNKLTLSTTVTGATTSSATLTGGISFPAAFSAAGSFTVTGAAGACTRFGPGNTNCACSGTDGGACSAAPPVRIAAGTFIGSSDVGACGASMSAATANSCSCTGAGMRTCTIGMGEYNTNVPPKDWFANQQWRNYLVYAVAPSCTSATPGCAGAKLTVGNNAVNALVVGAGRAVNGTKCNSTVPSPYNQLLAARPSTNICDYLDSLENTNGDDKFDEPGALSPSYNDQPLIVSPP